MNSSEGPIIGADALFEETEKLFHDIMMKKELLQGDKIQSLIAKIRQIDVNAFIWLLFQCNSHVKPDMLRFFFRDDLLYKCPILRTSIDNIIRYYELTGDSNAVPVIEDARRRIERDFFYQVGRACDSITIGTFLGKMTEQNLRSILGGLMSVESPCTLDERKDVFSLLVKSKVSRNLIREQCDLFESELDVSNKTTILDRYFLSHIRMRLKKIEDSEIEDKKIEDKDSADGSDLL